MKEFVMKHPIISYLMLNMVTTRIENIVRIVFKVYPLKRTIVDECVEIGAKLP